MNFAFTVQDFFANYTWNSGELYNQTQSRNVINNFPITIKWAFSYQRDKYAIQTEYELQSVEYEYENKELFIDDFTGIDSSRHSESPENACPDD